MTYTIGDFYTTTLTMQHPMFVFRGTVRHPTILLAVMTSQGKSIHDYNYLAQNLQKMGVKQLIYGTDGERALEQALENHFPVEGEQNIYLRCFQHLKDDFLRELKKKRIR